MEYIKRLPFILGAVMAIIVGMISFYSSLDMKQVYLKMAITMVVFYIMGAFIRRTVIRIKEETEERKKQEELLEQERLKKEELNDKENEVMQEKSSKIDIKVDVNPDDFVPFSTMISENNMVNEQKNR